MFKGGYVKDTSGFSDKDIRPKTIDTIDIETETLNVTKRAEINELSTNTIDTNQLTVNGQFSSTSSSTLDLNGNISINNQQYVLTISEFENALAQAAVTGGSSIFVAPGTFFVSSTIQVPANTDIKGSGINTTIFKTLDGFSSESIFTLNSNVSLSEFQIDGNNSTGRLISMNGSTGVVIERMKLTKSTDYMTTIENSCENIRISNIEYSSRGNTAGSVILVSTGSSNVFIENVNFRTIGGALLDYVIQIEDADPTGAGITTGTVDNISFTSISVLIATVGTLFYTESATETISNISLIDVDIDTATADDNIIQLTNGGTTIENIILTNIRIRTSSGTTILTLDNTDSVICNILRSTLSIFTNCIDIIKSTDVNLTNIELNNTVDSTRNGIIVRSDTATLCSDISITNCTISTGGIAIILSSTEKTSANDCIIRNVDASAGRSISIGPTSSAMVTSQNNISINNCTIEGGPTSIYVDTQDITLLSITTCNFINIAGIGIYLDIDTTNLSIKDCQYTGTGKFLNNLNSTTQTNLTVNACNITTSAYGIDLENISGTITGVIIDGNYMKTSTFDVAIPIKITDADNIQVINNNISLPRGITIWVINSENCIISNNRVSKTSASSTDRSIYCEDTNDLLIVNNNMGTGSAAFLGNKNIDMKLSATYGTSTDFKFVISNNILSRSGRIVFTNTSTRGNFTGIVGSNVSKSGSGSLVNPTTSNIELSNDKYIKVLQNDFDFTFIPFGIAAITSGVVTTLDRIYFDNSIASGNVTFTLSDLNLGSSAHEIYIELTTHGGNDLIVTPVSVGNDFTGLAAYTTNVTFNTNGEYAIFKWNGNSWDIINNNGGVIV